MIKINCQKIVNTLRVEIVGPVSTISTESKLKKRKKNETTHSKGENEENKLGARWGLIKATMTNEGA
jgi:hypothetical protein